MCRVSRLDSCLTKSLGDLIKEQESSSSHKEISCLAIRKYCAEDLVSYVAKESEILTVMSVDSYIKYLIFRETTENYIKDPEVNGVDKYDVSYYQRKKAYLERLE